MRPPSRNLNSPNQAWERIRHRPSGATEARSTQRPADFSMHHLYFTAIVVVTLLIGCATKPTSTPRDIRAALLEAARDGDPRFPDGRNVILTHFSHVGELRTDRDERIFVADRRAVLAGMLAPRGQNRISFFDERLDYLGSIGYVHSRPLWCEGSKLYLFGDLDGFPQPGQEYPPGGNVIDVSAGFDDLTSYHASVYGSSGGIED